MAAYVFGLLVLLVLWGTGLEPVMAYATRRFKLMVSQALVYWAIVLAAGYVLAALLTELALPHSKLASTWTLEQLQAVTHWSYGLGGLLVLALFGRTYHRLVPRRPLAGTAGKAASTPAKPRLKPVSPQAKAAPKHRV